MDFPSSVLIPILLAFIVALVGVQWKLKVVRRLPLTKLPGPRVKWSLFGNLDLIIRSGQSINESSLRALHELALKFKDDGLFKLQIGPMRTKVYLFKPELSR